MRQIQNTGNGPSRAYRVGQALAGALAVAGLLLAAGGILAYPRAGRPEADYQQSPNCSRKSPPTGALPPCRDETARVMARSQYTVYRHTFYGAPYSPSSLYSLTLLSGDGTTEKVSILHGSDWQAMMVGDQLAVQVWRHQVTIIRVNGHDVLTSAHPTFAPFNDLLVILAGGFLIILGVTVLRGMRAYRDA